MHGQGGLGISVVGQACQRIHVYSSGSATRKGDVRAQLRVFADCFQSSRGLECLGLRRYLGLGKQREAGAGRVRESLREAGMRQT